MVPRCQKKIRRAKCSECGAADQVVTCNRVLRTDGTCDNDPIHVAEIACFPPKGEE